MRSTFDSASVVRTVGQNTAKFAIHCAVRSTNFAQRARTRSSRSLLGDDSPPYGLRRLSVGSTINFSSASTLDLRESAWICLHLPAFSRSAHCAPILRSSDLIVPEKWGEEIHFIYFEPFAVSDEHICLMGRWWLMEMQQEFYPSSDGGIAEPAEE